MTQEVFFGVIIAFVSQVIDLEFSLSKAAFSRDITPLQHRMLRILYFSGSSSLSRLADCMSMSLPNCSREVKKLTAQGLILKAGSLSDKRRTSLQLSPMGQQSVAEVFQRMQALFLKDYPDRDGAQQAEIVSAMELLTRTIFSGDSGHRRRTNADNPKL